MPAEAGWCQTVSGATDHGFDRLVDVSPETVILLSKRIFVMTITLPAEQDSILSRLVAAGRYATREAALVDAVRRLEDEVHLPEFTEPLSAAEANQVYATDEQWETVERAHAGQAVPEV